MNRQNSGIVLFLPYLTVDEPLQLSRRISELEKENEVLTSKIEACRHTITRLRVERSILLEKLAEDGISVGEANPTAIDPDLAQMAKECTPNTHEPRIASLPIAVYNYPHSEDTVNDATG